MRNKLGKPVTQRQLRVGEMIKQSLGMIFVKNEAKVPNLETNDITVTEVKMSQDLKIAKAYVLPLGGKDADEKIKILTKLMKNELNLINFEQICTSAFFKILSPKNTKIHISKICQNRNKINQKNQIS